MIIGGPFKIRADIIEMIKKIYVINNYNEIRLIKMY
jgi:hypothetical protein